jgi:hypothetical protein
MSDDARPDAANDTATTTQSDESGPPNGVTADNGPDAPETPVATENSESAGDTFPRSYVEELRKESAGYRDRSKHAEERADALGKRLHRELVKATQRLENHDDLPFDAEHLDDADKLTAALDALLADRPYLKARKVTGDAGQGNRGGTAGGVNLLGLLRGER